MSSVEIEDVLSSIRRLVSEDLRPLPRAVAAPAPVVPRPALILTPALRVVPAAGAAQAAGVATPGRDPAEAESSIEAVVAVVAAAVDDVSDDWESETGDAIPGGDAPWGGTDWDGPGAEVADFAAADVDVIDLAVTDGAWDASAECEAAPAVFASARPVVAERGATAPAGLATQTEEMPGGADSAAGDAPVATVVAGGGSEAAGAVVRDDLPVDAPDLARFGAAPAFEFHRSAPRVADAQVIPPEVAPADIWTDDAEAEELAGSDHHEASGAVFDAAEDRAELTYDEELLRDLVRDLIREELQGGLGERITRNIRKLVRAEIARALAAAEFD